MSLQSVTANGLGDGAVVYLDGDGGWSGDLGHAATASGGETERLLGLGRAAETEQRVVGPYLIDVEELDGTLRPVRLRERIRASGPTI
jgi:hypothetical protein